MAPVVQAVSDRLSDLGEGPHWDAQSESLLYVDAFVGDVCRMNIHDGKTQSVHFDDVVTFAIPYKSNPDWNVITVRRQLRKLQWSTGGTQFLQEVDQDRPTNHFNDGKCDASGRLWAGTRGAELAPDVLDMEKGRLYSFNTNDLSAEVHMEGLTISNGMTWLPGNKTMFFIDSPPRKIYSFDFDLWSGKLSNKKVFLDFNANASFESVGYPDGMTHDVDGKLWISCFGGGRVIRVDPVTGQLMEQVKIPSTNTTSCCWGGPNLDELYVTTAYRGLNDAQKAAEPKAGAIFKVSQLGTKGYHANTFNM